MCQKIIYTRFRTTVLITRRVYECNSAFLFIQMTSSISGQCIICNADGSSKLKPVLERGLDSMIEKTQIKGMVSLNSELIQLKDSPVPLYAHAACRKRVIDTRNLARLNITSEPKAKRTRSKCSDELFDWKTCCFLCAKVIILKNCGRNPIRVVETVHVKESFTIQANKRGDAWGEEVFTRLEGLGVGDLFAAKAIYHVECSNKFRYIKEGKKRGRPIAKDKQQTFDSFCTWFDSSSDSAMQSVLKLHSKMCELIDGDGETFCLKTFREKFKERYQDHIEFFSGTGNQGDFVFKDFNKFVMKNIKADNKETAILAVARMLRNDIKSMNLPTDYPTDEELLEVEKDNKFVPESLQMFMSTLIFAPLKRQCLNQCIVQATRPRSTL